MIRVRQDSLPRLIKWLRLIAFHSGAKLTVGGRRYRLRGLFGNRMSTGFDHEPNLLPVLASALQERSGAIVDVGTNTGQTLIKVLSIDPTRRYVGLEPQIECCFFLNQFSRDNGLGNVTVLPIALARGNGMLRLHSSDTYDEMASVASPVRPDERMHRHTTWIPSRNGDELFEELGLDEIALIKIDVEGYELEVLSGLAGVLRAQRPILVFEVLPNFHGRERIPYAEAVRAEHWRRARAIDALLRGLGYTIEQIDRRGRTRVIRGFALDDRENFAGANFIAH